MKLLMVILLVAIAIGIAPVFASEVSAASPTNNLTIVKENVSENISDLNVATKPEATANVENSTTSEPAKVDNTTIQNSDDSTKLGNDKNSTNLKSGNNRELTTKEMKSIKAKGWVDDTKRFANDVIIPVVSAIFRGLMPVQEVKMVTVVGTSMLVVIGNFLKKSNIWRF